jgi:ElaA protein
MGLHFTIKKFKDLSSIECYKIFKLRFDIFVVEQNCIYDEFDNYDLDSLHIQLHNEENELIAYSRIFKPGLKYPEASFGRFVLKKELRGKGIADLMAKESINQIIANFGNVPIKIEAQAYLKKFYEKQGFSIISEPYDWDGILHVDMLRKF